jgi:hypothetical protein
MRPTFDRDTIRCDVPLVYDERAEKTRGDTHSHLHYSKSVNCQRGKFAKDLARRVRDPWCMTRLAAGYRTVSRNQARARFEAKIFKIGDVAHTSRKNRRPRMPCPASSQSMTGSAYSCIEAVKITSVYQADTLVDPTIVSVAPRVDG